ncbi:MAG: hypothetical protein JXB62_03910 [Pirellulales bacterium]|nr:hypothetical protein [Pirellulales bacterium]
MSPQNTFQRKILYLVGIVVLLTLLSVLGRPATRGTEQAQDSPGGYLAQLRQKSGLSQAELGQIDPTSETIKLATFGMRGVAANILWEKANRYKMKKDWTNLAAAVRQIIKLQPNFISVWIFQGWTFAYNVSVEFDDVRDRYEWVIKGINFLKEGCQYNQHDPRLRWETGWTLSNKIGNSDERRQFRSFFKADDDFHGDRPLAERDNWLVAKSWFRKAERLVDEYGVKMKGQGPLIYRANAAKCQMSYAEAIEDDGVFGEVARQAWKTAADEWQEYGKIDLPGFGGVVIQLNDLEEREATAEKLSREMDALQEGLRGQIREEKKKTLELTNAQREAWETPPAERDTAQMILADEVEQLLKVSDPEVARRITGPARKQAQELAKRSAANEAVALAIRKARQIVNFEYWRMRAALEQLDDTLAARELVYDGSQAFYDGDLDTAKRTFEDGLAAWRKVLDAYPEMLADPTAGDDLMDVIERYRQILELRDEQLPKNFVLQDVIDRYANRE